MSSEQAADKPASQEWRIVENGDLVAPDGSHYWDFAPSLLSTLNAAQSRITVLEGELASRTAALATRWETTEAYQSALERELAEAKSSLAAMTAERDALREKAALAQEAAHYCDYNRPFSNEDDEFWNHWRDRCHAITQPQAGRQAQDG